MPTDLSRLQVDVDDEDGRYHRQELISWWDQERLARARVLVVGAGALGNELLKNLALLGVGQIVVVDMDRVENSNLSRCVLFRDDDEGRPKAEAAAAAASALNPDVRVGALVADVRTGVGLGVFAAADLVLGGLDNREARLSINQRCWKASVPWIDGAIEGLFGTMRVFVPPNSACYECTMNERDHELIAARKSCALLTREQMLEGKVPTTATSASVIAGMQVQEAIKLIHADRIAVGFAGRGFVYNGLTHDSYTVTYPVRPDCLSHDTYELRDALSVSGDTTLRQMLAIASEELDAPVLEFEHEIVLELECPGCGTTSTLRRLLEGLTVADVLCPRCGAERHPVITHSLAADRGALLDLRPAELGLPPFDVITARSGLDRRHFRVDGALDPFAELLGDS